MSRRLTVLALLAAIAGCGGDGEALPTDRLRELVIQPDDVPEGFERFDEGRLAATDMPAGPRRDPSRFGRTGGWKARYRAVGGEGAGGMLLIESRIDAFGDSEGAQRDLAAHRDQAGGEGAAVGDEAIVSVSRQEAEPRTIRFTTVVWRHGTVTATVLVQGFEDALGTEPVLALARKQDERIERASDDP